MALDLNAVFDLIEATSQADWPAADRFLGALGENPLSDLPADERVPTVLRLVERVAPCVAPIPLYAIGGIRVTRIPELLRAGAHGVAVCSALLAANDPRRVAEAMTLALSVVAPPVRQP